MTRIRSSATLAPADAEGVLQLVGAAAEHDGTDPLSEQAVLRVRHGAPPSARLYLVDGPSGLAGFALAEGESAELVIAPDQRRRGYGGQLLDAVLADDPAIGIWAHGQHPGARALASQRGLVRMRGLRKMRMRLHENGAPVYLPQPQLRGKAAEQLAIRTFVPGQDEDALLRANARAFADHPEQGSLSRRDLQEREEEEWFDPAGLFVAEDLHTGQLAGFHWTKTHFDGAGLADKPVGEVYVVGIDPAWQGSGLGRALTLRGLHYLRDQDLPWALLYTEEDNPAAIGLYESLGFEVWNTDVLYKSARRG